MKFTTLVCASCAHCSLKCQRNQEGADTLDTRLLVSRPVLSKMVMAACKRVANNQAAILMLSAWDRCSLLDAFQIENQLKAALMLE